jgi:hypothetical protein
MIAQVIKTIRTLLPNTSSITQQQIEEAVNNDFALMMPMYSALDKDFLIREIESLYNIRMDDFRIIEACRKENALDKWQCEGRNQMEFLESVTEIT